MMEKPVLPERVWDLEQEDFEILISRTAEYLSSNLVPLGWQVWGGRLETKRESTLIPLVTPEGMIGERYAMSIYWYPYGGLFLPRRGREISIDANLKCPIDLDLVIGRLKSKEIRAAVYGFQLEEMIGDNVFLGSIAKHVDLLLAPNSILYDTFLEYIPESLVKEIAKRLILDQPVSEEEEKKIFNRSMGPREKRVWNSLLLLKHSRAKEGSK